MRPYQLENIHQLLSESSVMPYVVDCRKSVGISLRDRYRRGEIHNSQMGQYPLFPYGDM